MKYMEKYLLNKVDILHFIIYNAQSLKELELEDSGDDLKNFLEYISNLIFEIEFMIQDKNNTFLIEQALRCCENLRLSISEVKRNKKEAKRIFRFEFPSIEWNLFHMIHQSVEEKDDGYRIKLENRYKKLYSRVLEENILVINIHLNNSFEVLKKNIKEINNIANLLDKKCELISIAETEEEMELQELVSNEKRIRLQFPLDIFKIPPWISNGKFIMDVPRGIAIPSDFPIHVGNMLAKGVLRYEDESGIRIEQTYLDNIPYYQEAARCKL